MNHLYFGDCLDVLKQLKDENPQPFIDLIYIDPVADGGFDGYIVFNSNAGKQFALIETKSGHVNVKNV